MIHIYISVILKMRDKTERLIWAKRKSLTRFMTTTIIPPASTSGTENKMFLYQFNYKKLCFKYIVLLANSPSSSQTILVSASIALAYVRYLPFQIQVVKKENY